MLRYTITPSIQKILLTPLLVLAASLSVSAFGLAFAQNLSNENNAEILNNTAQSNSQKLTFSARGPITSIQNDDTGIWIAYGDWELVTNASEVDKTSSSPITFNATITTVKPDNTESHKHELYDFKLVKSYVNTIESSSILVFNGTGTVSTKNVTASQVPISIRIIDDAPIIASGDIQSGSIKPSWVPKGGTIRILIDDAVFPDHFGDSPVYGIVKKGKVS